MTKRHKTDDYLKIRDLQLSNEIIKLESSKTMYRTSVAGLMGSTEGESLFKVSNEISLKDDIFA